MTGFIDTILKFTIIWIIPSKIGGGIVGFLETWIFLFLAVFVLSQFSFSHNWIEGSKVSQIILNNTPIVGNYLGGATKAAKNIYAAIDEFNKSSVKDKTAINVKILEIQVNYGLITADKANELIALNKLGLDNVVISTPTIK